MCALHLGQVGIVAGDRQEVAFKLSPQNFVFDFAQPCRQQDSILSHNSGDRCFGIISSCHIVPLDGRASRAGLKGVKAVQDPNTAQEVGPVGCAVIKALIDVTTPNNNCELSNTRRTLLPTGWKRHPWAVQNMVSEATGISDCTPMPHSVIQPKVVPR